MIARRTHRTWIALGVLLAVALLGAACFGGNDNEDVDADELIRPTNSAFPQADRDAVATADDPTPTPHLTTTPTTMPTTPTPKPIPTPRPAERRHARRS